MRISDWSSDVCSSDVCSSDLHRLADLGAGALPLRLDHPVAHLPRLRGLHRDHRALRRPGAVPANALRAHLQARIRVAMIREFAAIDLYYLIAAVRWTVALSLVAFVGGSLIGLRSEEHTSELPSLLRISYAVFCLK